MSRRLFDENGIPTARGARLLVDALQAASEAKNDRRKPCADCVDGRRYGPAYRVWNGSDWITKREDHGRCVTCEGTGMVPR